MKLRDRLLLSSLAVILLVLGIFFFSGRYILQKSHEDAQGAVRQAVDRLVGSEVALSEKVLTQYGEKMVLWKTEGVAGEIARLLPPNRGVDIRELRENPTIRSLATQVLQAGSVETGYMDLYDLHGLSILHPNPQVEGHNYREWAYRFPKMWELVERSFTEPLVQGYYTFLNRENQPARKFMTLVRIPGHPLVLAGVVNIAQYFRPLQGEIRQQGSEAKGEALAALASISDDATGNIQGAVLLAFLVALAVGILVTMRLASSVSRPLDSLTQGALALGRGELTTQVPETGPQEFRDLARTFNRIGHDLSEHMELLAKETAARQAVQSEMKIAREIQLSLLPHTFPPYPDRREFELHAANIPAKEVAGDFYDFYFLDQDRLILAMGDVAGKGVPAALFMAMTRTLLRNICRDVETPYGTLARANQVLCQGNDSGMFVTLFLAFYQPSTGRLVYANAGHNLPFLLERDGQVRTFGALGGMALGVSPSEVYQEGEELLARGEVLVLYTDGLTEAPSPTGEQFGEARLGDLLAAARDQAAEVIVSRAVSEVEAFQKGSLFDDETILVLRHL
ncbi:MAG: SpoIIE family protein phosphatase [Deltaproteobacteria bacterium]|nr:SpoIIE family protein phosphatase [Deltaproteobacteria bacterium]